LFRCIFNLNKSNKVTYFFRRENMFYISFDDFNQPLYDPIFLFHMSSFSKWSTTGIVTIRSFCMWGNYLAVKTSSNVRMRLIERKLFFSFYSLLLDLHSHSLSLIHTERRARLTYPLENESCVTPHIHLSNYLAFWPCIHVYIQWVHLVLWPSHTHTYT
jgi:hypothetical protein